MATCSFASQSPGSGMSDRSSSRGSPLLGAIQHGNWSAPASARTVSTDGGTPQPDLRQRCWATVGPAIQATWLLAILVACAVRPCVLSFVYLVPFSRPRPLLTHWCAAQLAFFFQVQIVAAGGAHHAHRAKWLWGSLAVYSLLDIIGQVIAAAFVYVHRQVSGRLSLGR